MQSTPVKTDLNTSSLTPVRFVDSPKTKTSDNLGIHTRLTQIVKTLLANQLKWESAQKRGVSLCLSIEAIKTPALETKSEDGALYPDELKSHCEKLQVITGICEDILVSTKQSLQQLKALLRLSGNSLEVYFKSWDISQFIKLAEIAAKLYEQEIEIKRTVTEQIAHSLHRSELVLHSSVWEYPTYADDNLRLRFKFLSVETDLK